MHSVGTGAWRTSATGGFDVQMGEDQSRVRVGHAAQNLGTLRRLALNLLKREKTKRRRLKGKQKNAGWDHSYLLKLLGVPI